MKSVNGAIPEEVLSPKDLSFERIVNRLKLWK